jgi:predicted ATPase
MTNIKTNQNKHKRIVLTGGPCCGKTTTINALRAKGHRVMDEAARLVLEEGVYHPSKNVLEFQEAILRKQIESEQTLDSLAFLDRGAIDGVAYSLFFTNQIPEFFNQHNLIGRYDQVFLLDRFPLQQDGTRVESSDEEAQKIHDIIHRTYINHGYRPIKVPILPIEDRVNFILDYVKGGAN